MALSGSFKATGFEDKYMTFEWTATQSESANTSTISWTLKGGDPDGGYVKAGAFKVVIDGETVFEKPESYRIKMYTGTLIASGTKTIAHNANGSRTFTASAQAGVYNYAVNTTGSATFTLNTIPRKSTLTANNGTLGTVQTLTINRYLSDAYHRIKYTCGNASANITVDGSDRLKGTSVSFTPPVSLAVQNTSGTSVSLTFTLYTYAADGTELGTTSKTISCAIPASVQPTVMLDLSDAKGHLTTYGGYLQNLSQVAVAITAAGAQGSTIQSYKTTVDGKTYTGDSFTTSVLAGTGTLAVTVTVADSRGRTATTTQNITVLAYTPPKISSVNVQRCDSSGAIASSGAYLKVTFTGAVSSLSNENTAAYSVKYKKTSETTYTTATLSNYAGSYTVNNGSYIFEADTASTYDIQIVAADAFGSVSVGATGGATAKFFSWLAGGLGFAFGKVADKVRAFESAWDAYFNKNVYVDESLQVEGDTTLNGNTYLNGDVFDKDGKKITTAGYGLGGVGLWLDDFNALMPNGFYFTGAQTLNRPANASAYSSVIYASRTTAAGTQIILPVNSDKVVVRRTVDGGATWDEMGVLVTNKMFSYANGTLTITV